MKRKTIAVEEIKKTVNDMLLHSGDECADIRRGQACVLESILHKTGNYCGFRMLTRRDMEKSECGHSIGINDVDFAGKTYAQIHEEQFKNTDRTRVCYS